MTLFFAKKIVFSLVQFYILYFCKALVHFNVRPSVILPLQHILNHESQWYMYL